MQEYGLSKRRCARLVHTAPSVLRYQTKCGDDGPIRERLKALAQERPRWGYRRLHILLPREGLTLNRKKTHRLYKEENLHLRPKKHKRITSSTRVAPETAKAIKWTSCMTTWRVVARSEP